MSALLNVVDHDAAEPLAPFVDAKSYDEEASRSLAIDLCNRKFAALKADQRVQWALENLPGNHVLTSSFGAQAAVSLHLITQVEPNIPVVLVDTGYLFPETYRFVDDLTARLKINLKVYRAELSPAWQESRHGQRWTKGLEGLDAYNEENKVEPMRRALRELGVNTWFAGLRRNQTESRSQIEYLEVVGRTLEGSSDRGLDRSRRLPLPHEAQPALPPALGKGLCVDRRLPQHAPDSRSRDGRRDALLRLEARVRDPRDQPRRPLTGSELTQTRNARRPARPSPSFRR